MELILLIFLVILLFGGGFGYYRGGYYGRGGGYGIGGGLGLVLQGDARFFGAMWVAAGATATWAFWRYVRLPVDGIDPEERTAAIHSWTLPLMRACALVVVLGTCALAVTLLVV